MKRLSLWLLSAVLVVGILVSGLAVTYDGALAAEKDWPKAIRFSGGAPGTTYYAMQSAFAAVCLKHLKVSAAPSAAPGGSPMSTKAVGEGDAEFGISNGPTAYNAFWGKGPYKGKPLPIRAFTQGMTSTWGFFAPAKLNINSLKEIKGRNFGLTFAGSDFSFDLTEAFLKAAGLDLKKDVKDMTTEGVKVMCEMLKDGRLDVGVHIGGLGTAVYKELFHSRDMRMISLTPEEQKKIQDELGWPYPYTIPAGTYKGVDKDAQIMGFEVFEICRGDLPDSFVYELIKAVFDNFNEFSQFHPDLKNFSPKKVDLCGIPHHPGAIKYYKEVGVWTDELEAKNKAWLKQAGITK